MDLLDCTTFNDVLNKYPEIGEISNAICQRLNMDIDYQSSNAICWFMTSITYISAFRKINSDIS